MCLAAAENDVALIHSLVDSGVAVNAVEPLHEMTALHVAAKNGHVKAIAALAELGTNALANAPDANLNTPLLLAVENDRRDAVVALRGLRATLTGAQTSEANVARVEARIARRLRELATSTSSRDKRTLVAYLQAGADPGVLREGEGGGGLGGHGGSERGDAAVCGSVLHSAAANGDLEVVRALLDAGADVRCADRRGVTPLFVALEADADAGVVALLRDRGATLASPEMSSGPRKKSDMQAWLANYVNGLIEEKQVKRARRFLECGVNMNVKAGCEKRTPVHVAATVDGCEELLDWMLTQGGNPNETNRRGFTALAEAIETGCVGTSRVLRKHGALIGGPDVVALLSTACVTGDLAGALSVLEKGKRDGECVDVNTPMPGNRTLLHQAAEGGHHGIIRVLARNGADIFAKDGHGMSPLGTAMLRKRWAAALELLRCGAAPRVRVCETEGALLRALRIAKEADVKLVAVYWCGGKMPAISERFMEVADSQRAEDANCAFIVVHVSVEEISRGWMWRYIPRPGEKVPKPRELSKIGDVKLGRGEDGLEVAKTLWMTKMKKSAGDGQSRRRTLRDETVERDPASGGNELSGEGGGKLKRKTMNKKKSVKKAGFAQPISLREDAEVSRSEFADGVSPSPSISGPGLRKDASLRFRVKTASQLTHMTPEHMRAQMAKAQAKVAKWSRSFMIFQFYTVPGHSAVAASVESLLRQASPLGRDLVAEGFRVEETGDVAQETKDIDEVARKIAGRERMVLGWGGIDNYYKVVPQKLIGRIKMFHDANAAEHKTKRAETIEELMETVKEIEKEDEETTSVSPTLDVTNSTKTTDDQPHKKIENTWKQIYGVELMRTVEALPKASEAAVRADSDPDNLEYQRLSEESAAAAIEALEARSSAELSIAALAASEPQADRPSVRVVIEEGQHMVTVKGRERWKAGANVRFYLSMEAEAVSKAEALMERERKVQERKAAAMERKAARLESSLAEEMSSEKETKPSKLSAILHIGRAKRKDANGDSELDSPHSSTSPQKENGKEDNPEVTIPSSGDATLLHAPNSEQIPQPKEPGEAAKLVNDAATNDCTEQFMVTNPLAASASMDVGVEAEALAPADFNTSDNPLAAFEGPVQVTEAYVSTAGQECNDSSVEYFMDERYRHGRELSLHAAPGPVTEGILSSSRHSDEDTRRSFAGIPGSGVLTNALGHIKGGAQFLADRTGITAITNEIEHISREAMTLIGGNRRAPDKSQHRIQPDMEAESGHKNGRGRESTAEIAADFEQAPEEYYVLPQASGWAILETLEGGLHERGDLEEEFVFRFSWHAPYSGWLKDYISEIGPADFTTKSDFRRAAARGAARLVEYLDSTVPKAALMSHLADSTWKAESAPGSGRRAALHLAIVNCDVAAVKALLRGDVIRQVILPDSDACLPLFYAALRGVRMLTATVDRLRLIEKFTPEYISELLEAPNSHGKTSLHVVITSGHVSTAACLLREGVRLTTDTDQSLGRNALHSLAASGLGTERMREMTDLLLSMSSAILLLDAADAHGATALSLAVKHNHTYLALQLLAKGASLTPEAGELLGLENVLKVPAVLHSLVRAGNIRAIRWLVVRCKSDPQVVLARDQEGRTPRDLVRLSSSQGHKIHALLLAAEDKAMGLTDGYVEVGLTRPEDELEELRWEAFQAALKRQRRRRLLRCLRGCCDGVTCRSSPSNRVAPVEEPSAVYSSSHLARGSDFETNSYSTQRAKSGQVKVYENVVWIPGAVTEGVTHAPPVETLMDRSGTDISVSVSSTHGQHSPSGDPSAFTALETRSPSYNDRETQNSDGHNGETIENDAGRRKEHDEVVKRLNGTALEDGSDDDEDITAMLPEPAKGRISRHCNFDVLIAVRTDKFMSLDMVKDAIENIGTRTWVTFIRARYGVVGCLGYMNQRFKRWRAQKLWQWCWDSVRQRSSELARIQACKLVDLLRQNDMGSWVLELPNSVDGRITETLVAVSVSRDMLISIAEKAELFAERKDGLVARFRRDDVHRFKQYSSTRLFDPSTAQALTLRQLRNVTSHITKIGNETLDDCIFLLHDHDEGAGRAAVKAWLRTFPPQPLGRIYSYLWAAASEADAREGMVDLDNLQSYLGSRIAFYVSFLSVLCAWQCVVAVPAIAFTVIQCVYGLQVRLVLWNVLVVAWWGAAYTKSWANKSRELGALWQGAEVDEIDRLRSEFKGERRWVKGPIDPETGKRGWDVLCELVRIDAVKFKLQPLYPEWRRRLRYVVSAMFILIAIGTCGLIQYFVVIHVFDYGDGDKANPASENYDPWYRIEYKVAGGTVTGVIIPILNKLYQHGARLLTHWENHRLEEKHNDAMVVKFFLVESFNAYFSLFYLGFVKQNIYHLSVQLGSVICTRFIVDQLIEYGVPIFLQRAKRSRRRRMATSGYAAARRQGFLTEEESAFEQSTLPQIRDLYLEYAEMCIQYGYLVMFSPVFPVCFVLAALNNVAEIRGDLMKILHLGRRPVPKSAKDIGVWYFFLKFFTILGCFTNAGIVTIAVHTWKLQEGIFNVNSPEGDLGYDTNHVVVPFDYLAQVEEHVLFLATVIVLFTLYLVHELVVSSVPKWVQIKMRRVQHDAFVPEQLRQERHALESQIKMKKTFMIAVEEMKRLVDLNAWAVTRESLKRWKLYKPSYRDLVPDTLLHGKVKGH